MATPRFEVAIGVVDGANLIFYTPTPYLLGSAAVFLNGQLKRADFADGWVESNPSLGEVTLLQPPQPAAFGNPDDVVQVFYLDPTSPVAEVPDTEITVLHAVVLDTVDALVANLSEVQPIRATVTVC